ncbi:MAG: D-glycero-beta-D-manno-heptose 1,7-bisphosphate 7-phosphatase [Anaerolineae bacterium]
MRAIFLDRDGVICENRSDHVKSWDEFEFLPGAKESVAALSQLGMPIIVVTNQAIVGRGMVPDRVVDDIHRRMVAELEDHGGRISRVVYCPHRPEDRCPCRKPEPGMLYQVADEMGIDLSRSYMVGDAATDLLAGQRAGCQLYLVLTGRGMQQLVPSLRSVSHFTVTCNLMDAATRILKAELGVPQRVERRSAIPVGQLWEALSPVGGH